jgi:hypothetical protein
VTDPPRRYKELEELSVDELAQRRSDPDVRFETDAYRQARREALEGAGLEADDDAPKELEEMTAADLAARKYPANERN